MRKRQFNWGWSLFNLQTSSLDLFRPWNRRHITSLVRKMCSGSWNCEVWLNLNDVFEPGEAPMRKGPCKRGWSLLDSEKRCSGYHQSMKKGYSGVFNVDLMCTNSCKFEECLNLSRVLKPDWAKMRKRMKNRGRWITGAQNRTSRHHQSLDVCEDACLSLNGSLKPYRLQLRRRKINREWSLLEPTRRD